MESMCWVECSKRMPPEGTFCLLAVHAYGEPQNQLCLSTGFWDGADWYEDEPDGLVENSYMGYPPVFWCSAPPVPQINAPTPEQRGETRLIEEEGTPV